MAILGKSDHRRVCQLFTATQADMVQILATFAQSFDAEIAHSTIPVQLKALQLGTLLRDLDQCFFGYFSASVQINFEEGGRKFCKLKLLVLNLAKLEIDVCELVANASVKQSANKVQINLFAVVNMSQSFYFSCFCVVFER